MTDAPTRLRALAECWAAAKAAERANAQSYLIELCEALGVERPRPAGSGYEFEYHVRVVNRDGTETSNFADLVKLGFFLLEAKDDESGRSPEVLLRKAFGQARSYAANLPGAQAPGVIPGVIHGGTTAPLRRITAGPEVRTPVGKPLIADAWRKLRPVCKSAIRRFHSDRRLSPVEDTARPRRMRRGRAVSFEGGALAA